MERLRKTVAENGSMDGITSKNHHHRSHTTTNLWNNKRGIIGTDLISGIVAAIQRGISWFFTTAPKPLLYLIFLIFLVAFSLLFSYALNFTGNYCDTNGNEYTTGAFRIADNIELLASMPKNSELGQQEIPVDETVALIIPKCIAFFNDPYTYEGGWFITNRAYITNGSGYYYDGGFCTDCEKDKIFDNTTGNSGTYCLGDVYRLEDNEKSWAQKSLCGTTLGGCEPPANYYYDHNTASYVCVDNSCEGQTIGDVWNKKLLSIGAKIQEPDDIPKRSYLKALAIQCDVGDVNPKFKFFGIELFNYKLWVVIMLLSLLIWGVYKIKHP